MRKSLNFIIVCVFIFVSYTNVYSQISIDISPSFSKSYSIEIDYDGDHYFLTQKVQDSILNTKKYAKKRKSLRKKYFKKDFKNDSISSVFRDKMEIVGDKYSRYSIQKVVVLRKEKLEYERIINKIINLNKEELEKNEQNKLRFVLDGVHYFITVKHNGSVKILRVNSPTKNSNPEVYDFITETLNLFKEKGIFPPK